MIWAGGGRASTYELSGIYIPIFGPPHSRLEMDIQAEGSYDYNSGKNKNER